MRHLVGGRVAVGFGAFIIARWMIRSASTIASEPTSAGGCSWRTACSASTAEAPPNAGRPLSISNRMRAHGEEIRSRVELALPSPVPAPCSSACPAGLRARSGPCRRSAPRRGAPGRNRAPSPRAPTERHSKASGRDGRWSGGAARRVPTGSPMATGMASAGGNGPFSSRSASDWPSSSSIARNGSPSCSPISNSWQMFGWLTAAAARASRMKPIAHLRNPKRPGEWS